MRDGACKDKRGHSRKSAGDVGNVDHDARAEAEALEDLEVVAIRPFSRGSVAVVCVCRRIHATPGCPLKVWEAD